MATELGCHWGDYPIGFGYFKSIYALDLLGRLVLFNGTSEQKAMWRHSHRRKVLIELGQATIARVFDYLLADEVPHVHNGVRWGTHLLGGDEKAYREKVRELRAGARPTGSRSRAPAAPARRRYSGILERPLRPVLPLFETAFCDVWNGLRAKRPSLPGALSAPRLPRPRTFWPPRSGWRERRGNRNAQMSRKTQKPIDEGDGHADRPTRRRRGSGHARRAARPSARAARRGSPRPAAAPARAARPRARRARRCSPPAATSQRWMPRS